MGEALADARAAVEVGRSVIASGARRLAELSCSGGRQSIELLDRHQVLAYDLAHGASAVEAGAAVLEYGVHGGLESRLARAFVAEALWDLGCRLLGRRGEWGVGTEALAAAEDFVEEHRRPEFLERLAVEVDRRGAIPTHLPDDFELVRQTFHRFAAERVRPVAEHVHRDNADIPEEVITGIAELGAFGLSVPAAYGGNATGDDSDYLGMLVATEELSWGSLGVGGSLPTRPEVLTRAIVSGGTEEQKRYWLPRIATGEAMVAVTVTEPDYGSDVANLSTTAAPVDGGWRVNGVKTWATFAGRANTLMLLARTDPDRSLGHRGLSLFVVDKPEAPGHSFSFTQPAGGRMEGRAIDTIGYRGMHSYEISFQDWVVPEDHLIGGQPGLGRGFYSTMEGFANGRLQTAGRAVGLMQAAFEAALDYARQRKVFGQPILAYQLTRAKIAKMAAIVQAGRQFSYVVAQLMAKGEGAVEAAMVKAYVCRASEWVTREAMQIHGGMGYAEEFAVSRYFADARVLSIFEGADETLCLRVIARRMIDQALAAGSQAAVS